MTQAAPLTAPEHPCDLADSTTEAILAGLLEIGLQVGREDFRAGAATIGSPSLLADQWITRLEAEGVPAEPATDDARAGIVRPHAPLVAAAWELWKRWASDIDSAEILAEEFDRHHEPLDNLLLGNAALLGEALARADRILRACCPPGETADHELFQEIWSHCWHDLATWLRCLPLILAQRDQLDDAIRLCERLAPLFEARIFLSERAILLARVGRESEARRQVAANVRRWPRDPIVLKKACETLWSMSHSDEALLLYDQVLHLTAHARRRED